MTILLEIPDSIVSAMRLPGRDRRRQLKAELAISLYAQGALSLGKARELAEMDRSAFGALLQVRNIPRHYDETDLQDDLAYAGGE